MPAGLDKDDWSDSDYDLTEDEESSDSSLSNRIDGFLALQAPLDKEVNDEITATISTPCLKNSTARIDRQGFEITQTLESNSSKRDSNKRDFC